jgi:hypothetical protein
MLNASDAYPKQLFIASALETAKNGWQTLDLTAVLKAGIESALPSAMARAGHRTLALFGDAVDTRNSGATNLEIASHLVSRCDGIQEILTQSGFLSGSWIIFYADVSNSIVFHDAAGTKSVYYLTSGETPMCATDPEILGRLAGLTADPKAKGYEVAEKQRTRERRAWWPNDVTRYSGVKRLLPNHYLDLGTRRSVRYWPKEKLEKKQQPEIVAKLSSLMRDILYGFCERYKKRMAIVLTAGMDSRVLLAAAKPFVKELYFFVYLMPGMDATHQDISVPTRLARKLDLTFEVIPLGEVLRDSFEIVLRGGGGGIARGIYVRRVFQRISPKFLARVGGLSENAFALDHLSDWVREAEPISRKYGVDAMDLFLWEQRVGSWGADSALQSDRRFPYRILRPFSCRLYLEEALASPYCRRSRHSHNYRLLRKVIMELWPEVLVEEINPGTLLRNRLQTLRRHLVLAR